MSDAQAGDWDADTEAQEALEDELAGLEVVRAKWAMDGATTLSEAARMLEAYAGELRRREAEGWQLTGAIEDDYGYIRLE